MHAWWRIVDDALVCVENGGVGGVASRIHWARLLALPRAIALELLLSLEGGDARSDRGALALGQGCALRR